MQGSIRTFFLLCGYRRIALVAFLLFTAGPGRAQDTLLIQHGFKIGYFKNGNTYSREVVQYPGEKHLFISRIYDSCRPLLIVRSLSDSLDIRVNGVKMKLRSRSGGVFTYSGYFPVGPDFLRVETRTPHPCTFTFQASL